MARISAVLSDPLFEEFQRLVPPRQRAQFVTEAVKRRLTLLKQETAARSAAGSWSSEGREDPSQELEKMRAGWERQMPPDPPSGGGAVG
jgi:hypothetical protein